MICDTYTIRSVNNFFHWNSNWWKHIPKGNSKIKIINASNDSSIKSFDIRDNKV